MAADVLVLEDVSKSYRTVGNWWRGHRSQVLAVQNVSLRVRPGEIYGLMGESGSGKSTLARLVLALEKPTSGKVFIGGANLGEMKPAAVRALRREMQIVFQDPYGALNPLQTVEAAIEEPLLNFTTDNKARRVRRVLELLHEVGLPERLAYRLSPSAQWRRTAESVYRTRALAPPETAGMRRAGICPG